MFLLSAQSETPPAGSGYEVTSPAPRPEWTKAFLADPHAQAFHSPEWVDGVCAAGGFTDAPRDTALKDWETLTGRTAAIFHAYHKGDEKFPTKAEIAMTRDAAHPRVLLLNWKVAYGSTWAKVAAGEWRPLVSTYPLDRAARAHADLEGRRALGKVVLVRR